MVWLLVHVIFIFFPFLCLLSSRSRYFAETSALKFEALFTIFSDFLSSYRSAELDVRAKAMRLQQQQRQLESRAAMKLVHTKAPTHEAKAGGRDVASGGVGGPAFASTGAPTITIGPPAISEAVLSAAIAAAIASPAPSTNALSMSMSMSSSSIAFGQASMLAGSEAGSIAEEGPAAAASPSTVAPPSLPQVSHEFDSSAFSAPSTAPSTPAPASDPSSAMSTPIPSTPTTSPPLAAAAPSPSRLSAKNALTLGSSASSSSGGLKGKKTKRKGSGIQITALD